MTDELDRLRRELRETVDAAPVPSQVAWSHRVAERRARRRRARLGGVAAVLVVAAIGGGVAIARTGESQRRLSPADPSTSPTSAATTVPSPVPTTPTPVESTLPPLLGLGAAQPSWITLADSPLSARQDPAVALTGSEYLVWGGTTENADGAAYDPMTNTWRMLAASPLAARSRAIAVWTGTKLVVWGGQATTTSGEAVGDVLDDGALYDPVADAWYPIAEAPGGGRVSLGATAVWSGSEMLVFGGSAVDQGIAYDPVGNTWRVLPDAPIDARSRAASVWTGSEMVVWGGARFGDGGTFERNFDDGAAYDPATDSWRLLPPAPMQAAVVDAAWTGSEVVFTPGYSGDPNGIPNAEDGGGAYDPTTDSWSALTWLGQHPGTELVAAGDDIVGIAKGTAWIHEGSTGATAALGGEAGDGATAVWTGSEVLTLTFGKDASTGLRGLRLPVLRADSPTECAAGPAGPGWTLNGLQFLDRVGAATVWTGSEYIVWGGSHHDIVLGDGVAFDPASGRIRYLAPAPITARTGAIAVWTGSEVLIVGGEATVDGGPATQDAAAYDPTSDTWRRIVGPLGDSDPDTFPYIDPNSRLWAWIGDRLFVVVSSGATQGASAFTYDPTSGRFTFISGMPVESHPSVVAWTGSEVLVAGQTGGVDSLAAYRPAAAGTQVVTELNPMNEVDGGTWTSLGQVPKHLAATSSVWTGSELLFAGGGEPTSTSFGTAAFNPATGVWRDLGATPYHPGAELVMAGDRVMLGIKGGYQFLDPATGELSDGPSPGAILEPGTGRSTGPGAIFLASLNNPVDCSSTPVIATFQP
jgi:N-acetylneuraminic acid mutarotase